MGFDKITNEIQDLGKGWANVGLQWGRSMLESGAESLKVGAQFLSTVSTRLVETSAHTPTSDTPETPDTSRGGGAL